MNQPFIERKYFFFTYARVILDDELLQHLIRKQAYSYIVGVSHNKLFFDVPVSIRKKQTINIYVNKPMEKVLRGYNETARNEIRRTERMEELTFTVNDSNWDEVYAMYTAHRMARGLPIHPLAFLQWGILFNAYWNGKLISTITCYDAKPYLRIQNIFSRIAENNKELRRITGYVSRRLVYEICKFGNKGEYMLLDMASANFTNLARAGITQFKNSFGGEVTDEYTYTFKKNMPRLLGALRKML